MLVVWSAAGKAVRVGDRTYDPIVGTLLGELDKAAKFHRKLLRVIEVEGPDDPKIEGERLVNAEGEPIVREAETVTATEHAALVTERDELKTEVGKLKAAAAIAPDVTALTKERDGLKQQVANLTTEVESLRASKTNVAGGTSAAYAVDGISADQNAALMAAFPTADLLLAAKDEDVAALKGFGPASAKSVRSWIDSNTKAHEG